MVQMLFSQIQQAPGPDFRTVGKSLECISKIAKNSLFDFENSVSHDFCYMLIDSIKVFKCRLSGVARENPCKLENESYSN